MRRGRLAIAIVCVCVAVGTARAAAQTVVPMTVTGDANRRVDLLVLGDGYTSSQMSQFASDVETLVEAFFNEQPFQEYRAYFNIRRIEVASAESGASHPSSGISRKTAFGAYYGCNNIPSLICIDQAKVSAVMSLVPFQQRDIVLVVVNDTEYGGGAIGTFAVTSVGRSAMDVTLHEIGHSFGWLADEYGGPAPPACSDKTEPAAPNVTKAMDRADIKWSAWIDPVTPIPTTTTAHGIPGLYRGAAYCDYTLFRPTYDSKMRANGRPFEQINSEQLVKRIYECVDPVDSATPPPDAEVTLQPNESRTFSVPVPAPATHDLEVLWRLDGVDQPTTGQASALQFDLSAATLSAGPHTLTAVVADPTTMVRVDPDSLLVESVTWTVAITGDRPDFAVVPDASLRAGLMGAPGNRVTGTVAVQALRGYAGSVNLACSVSPAGPACSVTPSFLAAGSSAGLTLDLASAPVGSYKVLVVASDGQLTRSSAIALSVVVPDFGLASTGAMSGNPGTSQQAIVNVVPLHGYSGTVTVACAVVPAGPACRVSPATVAVGASFTVTVDVGRSNAGTYAVRVTGNDGRNTHSADIQLVVATGDFTVTSLGGMRLTVNRGGPPATVKLTAVPSAGVFNAALTFACSGLPAEAQCTFDPASIAPGATTTVSTTAAITAAGPHQLADNRRHFGARAAFCAAPFVLPVLGVAGCGRRRRDWLWRVGWMALAVAVVVGTTACSKPPQTTQQAGGTPPGTYAVTLTATSGTHAHSTTFVLVVQ